MKMDDNVLKDMSNNNDKFIRLSNIKGTGYEYDLLL